MTTLSSCSETIAYGKKIAADLRGGDIVLLYGDLGAGKTTLTKGIAAGLGIKKNITSPTFTLMNIYLIKSLNSKGIPSGHKTPNTKKESLREGALRDIKTLVHIDTYRLKNEQELIEIGVEDYIGKKDTICIIEWPEKVEKLLKNKKIMTINIKHAMKNKRKIEIGYSDI